MLLYTLMKVFSKIKKLRPLTKALIAISILVIGIGGWVTYDNARPRPLGNEMVYLGKKDYGNIFGFDSKPYSVYYYGTDMDKDSFANYFSAKYTPLSNLDYKNARFTDGQETFKFIYVNDAPFHTTKAHIVSIVSDQYEIAKKYLR